MNRDSPTIYDCQWTGFTCRQPSVDRPPATWPPSHLAPQPPGPPAPVAHARRTALKARGPTPFGHVKVSGD